MRTHTHPQWQCHIGVPFLVSLFGARRNVGFLEGFPFSFFSPRGLSVLSVGLVCRSVFRAVGARGRAERPTTESSKMPIHMLIHILCILYKENLHPYHALWARYGERCRGWQLRGWLSAIMTVSPPHDCVFVGENAALFFGHLSFGVFPRLVAEFTSFRPSIRRVFRDELPH